jgi:hypothetical protein
MGTDRQQSTEPSMKITSRPVVNVQVNAVAEDAGNEIAFRLEAGNPQSERYVTGPTSLSFPDGEELYKIHFHVKDQDCSYNLKFDRSNPICARDGECCPTSGGIEAKDLERSALKDRILTIDNYNSAKGPVSFALMLEDRDSGQAIPFDPIMDNGGGGAPRRL